MTRTGFSCANPLATASRYITSNRRPLSGRACRKPLIGARRAGPLRSVPPVVEGAFVEWYFSMTMTVGRIPYLSYEPFYFDMPRRGIHLIDLAPSAVAEAVEQGQIDAGPVALVDCFRLEGQYRLLSGFCLATIRKAGSVLLHAKQP